MTANAQSVTFEELHYLIREEQKKPGQSRWLFVQNTRGNDETNFERPDKEGLAWTGNWVGKPQNTDIIAHWVSDHNRLYIGKRSLLQLKLIRRKDRHGELVDCYKIPMESVRIFQVSEKNQKTITYEKLLQPQGSANGRVIYTYWPMNKLPETSEKIKKTIFDFLNDQKLNIEISNDIKRLVWCRTPAHRRFRENLYERWNGKCALTGLSTGGLLVASHIKPWGACRDTPKDQTNIDNGLLLLSPIDKLFDLGYITFDENGHIERHQMGHSRYLSEQEFSAFGLNLGDLKSILNMPEESIPFLKYHKDFVFNK